MFKNGSTTKKNHLQISPKTIQIKGVYDCFPLGKIFRIPCEREHERFTQKNYIQNVAQNPETSSRVNNNINTSSTLKKKEKMALLFVV